MWFRTFSSFSHVFHMTFIVVYYLRAWDPGLGSPSHILFMFQAMLFLKTSSSSASMPVISSAQVKVRQQHLNKKSELG